MSSVFPRNMSVPYNQDQLVNDTAAWIMEEHFHPDRVVKMSPTAGTMIAVIPEEIRSPSPTHGVTARLFQNPDDALSYFDKKPWNHINSLRNADPGPTYHSTYESRRYFEKYSAARTSGRDSLFGTPRKRGSFDATSIVSFDSGYSTSSSPRKPSSPEPKIMPLSGFLPRDPADMTFIALPPGTTAMPPMEDLVAVHHGRPGYHLLRYDEKNEQLYAW